MNDARPRVVIVGAGFGGLWAARAFAHRAFQVLLIDRNNYHTFLPLLYQVAAAEVEPEEIVYPVRSILRPLRNVDFLLADVRKIDHAARTVETTVTTVPYDYLILAAGSVTHFFGVPGAADHAFTLKTLDDGIRLRNHILCCFEHAAEDPEAESRLCRLTFAIVGGGPTGVEYAGALAELLRGPLRRDFPKLNLDDACVLLLEAADRLLPTLPARLGGYALQRLRNMGVEVRLKAVVGRVDPGEVHLQDGASITTQTAIWTAGVRGEPAAAGWGLPRDPSGRVRIEPTLEVEGLPGVYGIGDLARSEEKGKPLPMIAPVAIQQGVTAAENIQRRHAGKPLRVFHYHDRGMMATIGRNAAVAQVGGFAFTGFPAWLAWLGVHLVKLIGFRNRLFVLINWAWDYFLFERMVRLILPAASCRESSPPHGHPKTTGRISARTPQRPAPQGEEPPGYVRKGPVEPTA
jgi:NADH dehydrogenase